MPWSIMIITKVWILKNPLREYSSIVIFKIFTNNLLFISLIYSENLINLSWVEKIFLILYDAFPPFSPIAAPPIFNMF